MPEQILVIEDETKIASFISRALRTEGYQVQVALDGETGLEHALENTPDLIILDIMLPGIDGLTVCRQLRAAEIKIPVLMLTAKDAVPDEISGLDAGADDYLTKPFHLERLLAHIRALLRRTTPPESKTPLTFADLTLDPSTRLAHRGEREIEFTAKEYELLDLFMRHPRQVLTRDQIYEQIWGYDFGGESNIIEVYVRYLRAKLEADGEPRLLHTVRGVGYVLRES